MGKDLYTGMALLNVQKAFDCVDHSVLCAKLKAMGIETSWFESYLSIQRPAVYLNGNYSDECFVTCGVPQGLFLGSLLFLIYTNNMEMGVTCRNFAIRR